VDWRTCLPRSILAGLCVGLLTGLFGVGGGFVIVPALILLLGLSAQQAVATSLAVVFLNSVAGLTAHAGAVGGIDYPVLVLFAASSLTVSLLAARLAPRLPAASVRRWFACIVLAVAAGVATTALLAPSVPAT
ncbi:hypothetical protein N566_24630, partial [Streptomycetaceae bacterium MP113-05]